MSLKWVQELFSPRVRHAAALMMAGSICHHCHNKVPHHTNGSEGISAGDRLIRYDLHAVPCDGGVTLEECLAGDLWLRWERSAKENH